MLFDIDPIYLVWLFIAISAGLAFEAVYLLCFSAASYRSRINRRLYSPDMREVDAAALLRDLCEDIKDASGSDSIVCHIHPSSVKLSRERAMLLSLLVAELMLDKTMLQDVLAKKLGRPRGAARWWSTYTRPTG